MAARGSNSDRLSPIDKQSVLDQIIAEITAAIANGRFKAGSKMPNEFELMDELHVSRNSLREAMKMLECMGIVEIRRGDGTYVCSQMNPSIFDNIVYSLLFDLSTSQELLELRQILDEAIVRLAIDKITPEDVRYLDDNIQRMSRMITSGDVENASLEDYEFHNRLIEISQNTFFVRILKGVYKLFAQSISKSIYLERLDSNAPVYHKNMLDCIVEKRYADVSRVVADSLDTWRDII